MLHFIKKQTQNQIPKKEQNSGSNGSILNPLRLFYLCEIETRKAQWSLRGTTQSMLLLHMGALPKTGSGLHSVRLHTPNIWRMYCPYKCRITEWRMGCKPNLNWPPGRTHTSPEGRVKLYVLKRALYLTEKSSLVGRTHTIIQASGARNEGWPLSTEGREFSVKHS